MSEYKIAIQIAGQLESSFNSAISGAQKGLSALGSIGKVGAASVKYAGTALMGTGAAIAAVGAASVKVGSDFESAMSSVAATAHASEEDYAKLEKAAMEMGRTTSKTATESANALEYMALAGWDVDTSIQALPSVLKMSEASGMDLARCSDLVTDSMSALGVSVDDLPTYLDIAAKAQNKSNQSAEQLMEAYLGVGGVMNNLNVPLAESAAALGVMANRGIKGSEAGTALNAIMTNLTTGTGQAGEMMEKLGVSAFDSEGNFIGLHETLSQLDTALKGCTEEERNAALAAIGGKTHVDALNDLMMGLNETNEDGKTEWEALQNNLENCKGAMEEMRDTKLDNLKGDLATLGSAAQDAGIKIYKHLQGSLRDAAQYGTQQIYRLSDALGEGGFAGMAAEIGPMISENLSAAVDALPEAVSKVEGVFDAFFDGLKDNSDSIGDSVASLASSAVQGFMEWYGDFYSTALYLVEGFMSGLTDEIPNISSKFGDMIGQLQTAVDDNLPSIVDSAGEIATSLIEGLTDNTPALIDFGTTIVSDLATGVKDHATDIAGAAVDLLGAIGNGIIDNAGTLANAGLDVVEGLATAVADNLPNLLDTASGMIDKICEGLDSALSDGSSFVTRAVDIVGKLGTAILDNAPQLLEIGIKLLGALAKGVLTGVGVVVANIPAIINGIVDTIASVDWIGLGQQLIMDIAEGIASLGSAVIEAAKEIFDQLMHLGEDSEYTSHDIVGYTQTMDGRYTNDNGMNYYTAEELAAQGVAGAAEVVASYAQVGEQSGEAYGEGIADAAQAASDAAKQTSQEAYKGFQADASVLEQYGANMNENLAEGIASTQGAVTAQASETGSEAVQAASKSIEANSDAINSQVDTMVENLISQVSDSASASTEGIESAMQDASTALESGTAVIPEAVAEATTNASEAFSTLSSDLSATGTDVTAVFTEISSQIATSMTEVTTSVTEMNTSASEAMTGLQESVSTALNGVSTDTTTGMTSFTTAVSTGMTQAKTTVSTSMTAIKSAVTNGMNGVVAAVRSGMTQFVSAIQSGCSQAISAAQSGASGIRSAFSSIDLSSTGSNIMQGLINGLESRRAQAVATAQSIAAAAAAAANAGAQVKSPSRLTTKTGAYMGEGLVVGMESMRDTIERTAQAAMVNPVLEGTDQFRSIETPEFSRTGVIGETISSFSGGSGGSQTAQTSENSPTIVFSPTYHFEGDAPSKKDIVDANRMSQSEFEKMMKDYLRKNKRVAFA